ncbi:hypothetical protein AMECASPLE_009178 [Ameca splendens]|uniref:Uncharacterized protein n=1 Tax=Ameca splendens TaxID=208324 RepID=A0ABV0YZV7_9TELE
MPNAVFGGNVTLPITLSTSSPQWRQQDAVGMFFFSRHRKLVRIDWKMREAKYRAILEENLLQSGKHFKLLGVYLSAGTSHTSSHQRRSRLVAPDPHALECTNLSSGSSRVTGHCVHPVSSSGDQVGLLELR